MNSDAEELSLLHHTTDTEYENNLDKQELEHQLDMIANLSIGIDDSDLCRFKFIFNRLYPETTTYVDDGVYCPDYYDSVLCWPQSRSGFTVSLPCPDEIFTVKHETIYNVTRFCHDNGTWAKANYTGCIPHPGEPLEQPISELHLTIMYYMYWAGYSISLIFLLVALIIFFHYKSLWCLRNIIHTNLILCFALHNLIWIFYALIAHEIMTKTYQQDQVNYCFLPTMIIRYFIAAGFFWMFVEGVYLFVSVMFSFHANRIRFWMCATVGWGVPFLLIIFTSIVWAHHDSGTACWMEQYQIDYIFLVPVLAVLFMNVLFLVIIMYVVITKLQTTVRMEATRYKKAIKALFILCPLLGMNYIVVVAQTATEPMWLRLILSYYNTIMSSIQGLLVAVFFCFRNNEVRISIRKSFRRFRRAVKQNQLSTRDSMQTEHADILPNRLERFSIMADSLSNPRQKLTQSAGTTAKNDYSKLCNVIVMDSVNGNLQSYRFRCQCQKYNSLPVMGARKLYSVSSGSSVSTQNTSNCSTRTNSTRTTMDSEF